MGLGIALQQTQRTRCIGPDQIEQKGRRLSNAKQDRIRLRKLIDDRTNCAGVIRCEIGEPVTEALLGLHGREQLRPADELRGQHRLAIACCG
jgi:hypothetical protein